MDLQLIFDVLIYSNPNISDEEDTDGKSTIDILANTKKILQIINSKEPGSLGLHPIIYFYSKKGNFKPANFYAIILLIRELKQKNRFNEFTDIRKDFEEFIYKNDYIAWMESALARSTKKSSDGIKSMFLLIIDGLKKELSEKEILISIKEKYININLVNEDEIVLNDSFNTNRKSETYISTALQSVVRCSICGGVVHVNATSVDHIIRKREGGLGTACNGQITHPYCNTGYKH